MKKLLFCVLAALCFMGSSCELIDLTLDNQEGGEGNSITFDISPCDDGEDIAIDSLPQAILDYLNGEYPNIEIEGAEVFYDMDQEIFGVKLANGLEILFDENGVIIASGDENLEVDLAIDSLLQGILDYINANFPQINIDEASIEIEYGEEFFEIDLDNGLDLFFDELGDFICQDDDGGDDDDGDDDDGDDDDEGLSLDDLPDSILDYLSEQFPGLSIEGIDVEELCGDTKVIEIELEDENEEEIKVYFSLEWDYLFMSVEVSEADLPMAVLDSLASAYPGYTLEDDDIYRWTLADGSIQYKLEVDTDQEDYDVVVDADGVIICTE
ncbi:MAG: PepSY-like domain-containing protein [Saprospiraceae bacterium]|nr:PepSY-like domain-containing protein [Saprospiraceae bacterium]